MLIKILREQKGSVITLVCGGLVLMMACSAIAIDLGNLYVNKSRLQNIVDTAALAGAQQFFPNSVKSPTEAATENIGINGEANDSITITPEDRNWKITVKSQRTVLNSFAVALGIKTTDVAAQGKAQAGYISATSGCAPWGIVEGDFEFDIEYTFKVDGGCGSNGNYGALALDGTGKYKETIINGSKEKLWVGKDDVLTEPGVKAGPTNQGVSELFRTGKTTVIIPIIKSFEYAKGRSVPVTIVGFAAFELVEVDANKGVVRGKFKKRIMPGELSNTGPSYGLRTVKLIG